MHWLNASWLGKANWLRHRVTLSSPCSSLSCLRCSSGFCCRFAMHVPKSTRCLRMLLCLRLSRKACVYRPSVSGRVSNKRKHSSIRTLTWYVATFNGSSLVSFSSGFPGSVESPLLSSLWSTSTERESQRGNVVFTWLSLQQKMVLGSWYVTGLQRNPDSVLSRAFSLPHPGWQEFATYPGAGFSSSAKIGQPCDGHCNWVLCGGGWELFSTSNTCPLEPMTSEHLGIPLVALDLQHQLNWLES